MEKRKFLNPQMQDSNSNTIIVHTNGFFHTRQTSCGIDWEFNGEKNYNTVTINIPHQTFQLSDIDELLSFLFVVKDRLQGVK